MDFIYEPGRIYREDENGKVIAEITYTTADGVSNIEHTFVDASLRGQGVAGQLVKAAADQILKEGNQIRATCSYAVSWFEKHKEYSVADD